MGGGKGGKGGGGGGKGGKGGGGGGVRRTPGERKEGRRQMQKAAEQRKADQEVDFFYQCQRDAQRGRGGPYVKSAQDLFAKQGAAGINFDKYDSLAVEVKGPGAQYVQPLEGFADLGKNVPAFLWRNIERMGYNKPTPIQKHSIPLALDGKDLMCCAQTGSGKTCAFLLPVAASLGAKMAGAPAPGGRGGGKGKGAGPAYTPPEVGEASAPMSVVIAPTRELALQIAQEAEKLCYGSSIRPVVVYGGADQKKQVRDLAFGGEIVVATPGRLTDFIERGIVSMAKVCFLVLDEADRMLDMGFEPQIRRIVLNTDMPPKERRQTLLFSATFPAEVQKLAAAFLRPYVWIGVGRVGSTVENIEQRLIRAPGDKRRKLKLVVRALNEINGLTLVFTQTKRNATWVRNMLRRGGPADGYADEQFRPIMAEDIHGDKTQPQREQALHAFREGRVRVLVATDVAARGLDIAAVEHVINMDLPVAKDDFDSYVHRIGRTGRAGHTGVATSLYVPGYDKRSGNAAIAHLLHDKFLETKSEIPSWFFELDETRNIKRGGRAPTGGEQFGGQDIRNNVPSWEGRTQTGNGQANGNGNGYHGNGNGKGHKGGAGKGGRGSPAPQESSWRDAAPAPSYNGGKGGKGKNGSAYGEAPKGGRGGGGRGGGKKGGKY